MSAKYKLILSIGGLFATVITIITIASYMSFRGESTGNASQKLKSESLLIASALDQHMERYFDSLNVLEASLPISADGTVNDMALRPIMKALLDNLSAKEAYVGLENGDSYDKNGQEEGFNAKALKREWYTRIFAGEKKVITTPYQSSTGLTVMAVAVPVVRDGKIVSTLNVNVATDRITKFAGNLTSSSDITVTRQDGFVFASESVKVGTNLLEQHSAYKTLSNKPDGQYEIQDGGQVYVVQKTTTKELGWVIWARVSKESILDASTDNLTMSVLTSMVLVAISLFIVFLLINKLMYRPLGGEPTEIESLVKDVSEGLLTLPRDIKDTDTGIFAATIKMIVNLRDIVTSISTTSASLKAASESASAAAYQTNRSSQAQMGQIESTSTAMNEMTATAEDVARSAIQASEAANIANEHSTKGEATVSDMNAQLEVLVTQIEQVAGVNKQLEQETQAIDTILDVIDSISEQTNLLALNAAIEAARAGGHGRGFAVVADEVRNLANRTKESTQEIQTVIARLQGEAKRSVSLMENNVQTAKTTSDRSIVAAEALKNIKNAISEIQDMNNQIATAAEQQTQVASEINNSIIEINDMAKQTYESSESSKKLSTSLAELSNELDASIDKLKM
ncbi:methyl-accepting chemotaxis protein [Marinomonas pollencensis]|uniref:Methyl-accepting chemotaxis sensory transducer with Cache sensor n=1 Tax=Marinomonas pollencensis TaxID=491954 RepID=A0A3E0DIZ9_9GAMM|nr:methyl-accepting chemotaxis protein [Marinomonas pollencensis]REG82706.1 methyl-accepting chemotaxis sensory transducer with Cache sensor [Marinomonas pollencensis]